MSMNKNVGKRRQNFGTQIQNWGKVKKKELIKTKLWGKMLKFHMKSQNCSIVEP